MTIYNAESFYRAQIKESILQTTSVPFALTVSVLPTLTSGLLTISPNTEYEEIVEYNNPNPTTMEIDIIKRGIKPSSILLTTNGVDYNNTTYYKAHTQNDIIRGDVNHIHINQGIGNSTLATSSGVGISKLSVAAVDAGDPIVVGTNDPRVGDASTTQKATVKLSVAPVSASNPIAVGDNDSRVSPSTTTNKGIVKMSVAPVDANNPIAIGDNDGRINRSATDILKGEVELATDAEVKSGATTGTSGPLVISPAQTLVSLFDEVTSVSDTDYVLVNVGGVNKKTQISNLKVTHSPISISVGSAQFTGIVYSSASPLIKGMVSFELGVSSTSGFNAPGSAFIQYSPNGTTGWTTFGPGVAVVNGTASPISVVHSGGYYYRVAFQGANPGAGGSSYATIYY